MKDGKRYELRFSPTEMKKQIEGIILPAIHFTQLPSTVYMISYASCIHIIICVES